MIKNNVYFKGKRYATKGIIKSLDAKLLILMWRYLDHFIASNKVEPDYLQIFKLQTVESTQGYQLSIRHEQEVPEFIHEEVLPFSIAKPIHEKVYVISDLDEEGNEYSTMLLASEY
jgi:Staphylococcal protein of unknown function (DUF960)